MTGNSDKFISVYKNALSPQACQNLIKYFEWCSRNGLTWRRGTESSSALNKNDEACTVNPTQIEQMSFSYDNLTEHLREFTQVFWQDCYADYAQRNPILNETKKHGIITFKIQKTLPGEGYHQWHCEVGDMSTSRRILVYSVYLNDVAEGGETEFLNQGQRVRAEEGSILIFPASFTHVHRGNPPLSGVKYIMTGWVEFI